jgi:hypothetical protein
VESAQCYMRREDAPSGFWRRADGAALVDGVRLTSDVPTRFFQTVDAFPAAWGRLRWRIQLNRMDSGRVAGPMFRTFYPGVEWNLTHPAPAWFLTAWFTWEGPGPRRPEPRAPAPARIDGDTALFRIAWMPPSAGLDQPLFLRCRVDARDRRRMYEARLARDQDQPPADPDLIVLDDLLGRSE